MNQNTQNQLIFDNTLKIRIHNFIIDDSLIFIEWDFVWSEHRKFDTFFYGCEAVCVCVCFFLLQQQTKQLALVKKKNILEMICEPYIQMYVLYRMKHNVLFTLSIMWNGRQHWKKNIQTNIMSSNWVSLQLLYTNVYGMKFISSLTTMIIVAVVVYANETFFFRTSSLSSIQFRIGFFLSDVAKGDFFFISHIIFAGLTLHLFICDG